MAGVVSAAYAASAVRPRGTAMRTRVFFLPVVPASTISKSPTLEGDQVARKRLCLGKRNLLHAIVRVGLGGDWRIGERFLALLRMKRQLPGHFVPRLIETGNQELWFYWESGLRAWVKCSAAPGGVARAPSDVEDERDSALKPAKIPLRFRTAFRA